MSFLLVRRSGNNERKYYDFKYEGSKSERENALLLSTTLYVGNLSFRTRESQLHALFQRAGPIKRLIMGLDRVKKTPCGFCFVEYYTRKSAQHCMDYINGTKMDDRVIRTDFDSGFTEGRQFGRGRSGGQVRDEHRTEYDEGRGGYSNATLAEHFNVTSSRSVYMGPSQSTGSQSQPNTRDTRKHPATRKLDLRPASKRRKPSSPIKASTTTAVSDDTEQLITVKNDTKLSVVESKEDHDDKKESTATSTDASESSDQPMSSSEQNQEKDISVSAAAQSDNNNSEFV